MEITWYGHSCFRLTERGKATVVTDPFDHRTTGTSQLKLKADIVTISHDAPGYNHVAAVKGKYRLIEGPGEFEIGGVFITAVQSHANKRKPENGIPNILYVFDYDNVVIAHLGVMKRVPSQTEMEALGNVHVALVPLGGDGLTPAKAVEVVSLLEPGVVIPMHFETPKSKGFPTPITKFLKEMGMGKVESQPSLKVSRGTTQGDTRVVVLDYQI